MRTFLKDFFLKPNNGSLASEDFCLLDEFDIIKISNDGLWDNFYGQFTFSLKFIKIFLIMILQIFSGKLILSYYEGETFIFILKKND